MQKLIYTAKQLHCDWTVKGKSIIFEKKPSILLWKII